MGQLGSPAVKAATCVYILTENRLVRESLARMLQNRADLSVVGVSGFRELEHNRLVQSSCSVLLTDALSSRQVSEFLGSLSQQMPMTRIVAFGMEDDSSSFLRAVQLGVSGYLLNDASASEIVGAVRAVCQGEAVCPPRLCMMLIEYVSEHFRAAQNATHNHVHLGPSLTHRQLELVDLVARGLTNKEIAVKLNLSEFTVKNHIRRIMKRTEAEDRHQVVRMVRGHGAQLSS
jgi:DNA-binding NarL/FixJ family response regulator